MSLNIKDIVDIRPASEGFRPPPDSSLLPEGHRYVPITFRMKKSPTVQDLVPYMIAATYLVLSLLLLQWRRKTWPYKISDGAIWIACVALHHLQQSWLSLHVAISYTVWNVCPGSLASRDLPGHKRFMRNLKTSKASETSAECRICWSDDCDLANLSCGHHFCVPCLQQMGEGERFQTTCPMCRKPLFGVHDRLLLITTKGTYVCLAITLSKGLMDLSFALMQSRYGWAVFYLMMLGFVLAFPIYAVLKFRAAGISATERLLPSDREPIRTRSQMRISTITFACSVATAFWNAWSDYCRFN